MKFLLALLLIVLPFGLTSEVNAEETGLLSVREPGELTVVRELSLNPGEGKDLLLYFDNKPDAAAISGKIVVSAPDAIEIVNVEQYLGVCTSWDDRPEYSAGEIDFACGLGEGNSSAGALIKFRVIASSKLEMVSMRVMEFYYIDQNGKVSSHDQANPLLDVSRPLQNSETSARIELTTAVAEATGLDTRSGMILIVNFVLVSVVIGSLILAYRYHKLTNSYLQ